MVQVDVFWSTGNWRWAALAASQHILTEKKSQD